MKFLEFYRLLEERVYHGSTHKITDRMSLEYVGKGEGVQAFGWGLYFAENVDVASGYMNAGNYSILIGKKPLGSYQWFQKLMPEDQLEIYEFLNAQGKNLGNKESWMTDLYRMMYRGEDYWGRLYRTVRSAKKISFAKGYLYSINIDATEEQLLDWDIAIQDSKSYDLMLDVLNSNDLKKFVDGNKGMFLSGVDVLEGLTGEYFYKRLSNFLGSDKQASLMLLKHGIKGLYYWDQNSRSVGKGTHNFVIFDESLVHVGAGTTDKDQMLMDFGG